MSSSSAFGAGIDPSAADVISRVLVSDPLNHDLQWNEGSYRGFFTLTIDSSKVNATYWAMQDLSEPLLAITLPRNRNSKPIAASPNLEAFPSAQFIVEKDANKLSRPVGGGTIRAGVLKSTVPTSTAFPCPGGGRATV